MKITRQQSARFAEINKLVPAQIDGIPEGFSWKSEPIQIGNRYVGSEYFALVPNGHYSEDIVHALNEEDLLVNYNLQYGKRQRSNNRA